MCNRINGDNLGDVLGFASIVIGVLGALGGVVLGHWLARRAAKEDRAKSDAAQILDLVTDYDADRTRQLFLVPTNTPGSLADIFSEALEPPESPRKQIQKVLERGRLPADAGGLIDSYFKAAKEADSSPRDSSGDRSGEELDREAILRAERRRAELHMHRYKALTELRDYLRDLAR